MGALRQAGRPVPLIVLSSCSGGSASHAMAAGLIERGADRVIAMLAPVTDGYATILARHLYQELAARPGSTVGQALARARVLAEEDRAPTPGRGCRCRNTAWRRCWPPAATGRWSMRGPGGAADGRDTAGGWQLGAGTAGRGADRPTAQLRTAMGCCAATRARYGSSARQRGGADRDRRDRQDRAGRAGDLPAARGRLADRRARGPVESHRPDRRRRRSAVAAAAPGGWPCRGRPGLLADPGVDDGPKLAAVAGLLRAVPLLRVFDDFEQNLTTGGQEFLDPAINEVITRWRTPPGPGRCWSPAGTRCPARTGSWPVPVPPLSAAELRRMFLRLPALAALILPTSAADPPSAGILG